MGIECQEDLPSTINLGRKSQKSCIEIQGYSNNLFALPFFPTTDQRKTGLLSPNLGRSSKRGLEISLPYYWNLAPNIDLTTTPTLMAKRGIQLSTELRFLTAKQEGKTLIDYLPNDDKYNKKDRTYISHSQTINLSSNWRMKLDGEYASDNSYFEDLTGTMSSTSRTHLLREIQLEKFSENWFMEIRDGSLSND